jgi:DNA recombination protein RmuC
VFVEIAVSVAVALLAVLVVLHARRPAADPRIGELQRDLSDLRAAQEAGKAEVARAHVTALEGFHARVGELTKGLTDGQGAASKTLSEGLEAARRTLDAQIAALAKTLNDSLATSQQGIGTRLAETGQVVTDLRDKVAALRQAAEGMQALGKEVAELQNVLRAPKLRGNLGEALLEELLAEILPPGGYEMPHRFSDGTAVDAAIRLKDQWVPVDAKFPLEAFNRMQAATDDVARAAERRAFAASVRARIDEIASKYVRPDEGTFPFALMYLPAEGIYYEVVVRDDAFGSDRSLLGYATEKKVVPVSPNTLYAYLATIVMGLRGMHVEERAREIQAQVATLQQRFAKFFEEFARIGRHIEQAHRKFEDEEKRAGKLNDLMGRISGVGTELPEGVEDEATALPP